MQDGNNTYRKIRYYTDPEWQEKEKARKRKHYAENKEKMAAYYAAYRAKRKKVKNGANG